MYFRCRKYQSHSHIVFRGRVPSTSLNGRSKIVPLLPPVPGARMPGYSFSAPNENAERWLPRAAAEGLFVYSVLHTENSALYLRLREPRGPKSPPAEARRGRPPQSSVRNTRKPFISHRRSVVASATARNSFVSRRKSVAATTGNRSSPAAVSVAACETFVAASAMRNSGGMMANGASGRFLLRFLL